MPYSRPHWILPKPKKISHDIPRASDETFRGWFGPYVKVEKSDQTDFKSKYQMSEKLVVVLIVTGECEADTIDI